MAMARKVDKINVPDLVDLKPYQIRVAKDVLHFEQQAGNFPTSGFITLVDNKQTEDLTRLKTYGKIAYFAPQQLQKIALDAIELLIANSPIGRGAAANRTGRYWEAHTVVFNGKVLTGQGSLAAALDKSQPRDFSKDEIIIVNTQPYARKIERGHSHQTPKGVYKRVTAILRRKYSGIAFITQRYIKASSIPGLAKTTVTQRKKTKGGITRQVTQVYPAIKIRRGRGTL